MLVGLLLLRQAATAFCIVTGAKLMLMALEQPYPIVEASGMGLTLDYALCYLQRTAYCVPAVWTAVQAQELWDATLELADVIDYLFLLAHRNIEK